MANRGTSRLGRPRGWAEVTKQFFGSFPPVVGWFLAIFFDVFLEVFFFFFFFFRILAFFLIFLLIEGVFFFFSGGEVFGWFLAVWLGDCLLGFADFGDLFTLGYFGPGLIKCLSGKCFFKRILGFLSKSKFG